MITIEIIAQIAHEINAIYCKSIGDTSQVPWDEAPDWQKESCIIGVKMHLLNPNATPEDGHKSWLKQKKKDGWQYGEYKDEDKKIHPCIMSYNSLPTEQRIKDYLFSGVVKSMADLLEIKENVMTEGEYLVGINFNPGGHEQVNHIKRTIADLIDYVQQNGKDGRCTSICIHQLEDAAMWGVKSVTKPKFEHN